MATNDESGRNGGDSAGNVPARPAAPGTLASGLVVNSTGSGGNKPLVASLSAEEVRRNRLSLDKASMKNAKTVSRSAEDMRRNCLNMQKMIRKNVKASSRPNTKNRAQQIMELALKKKRQQQGDAEGADDVERGAKRKKTSPPHGDADARAAVIAGILSPGRRPTNSGAASTSVTAFASPTRGYHPHQRSPIMALSSPARARTMLGSAPLHLASPVRPPRSSTMASPKRPTRSGNVASPLRRNEFLTSPLRHRASASPKRPLLFEESSSTASADVAAPPSLINGHPPLLSSVLDQVEVAPAAKVAKVARSSKSPFQSFQAKFNKSPARVGQPTTMSNGSLQQRESGSAPSSTRSGPMIVDLSHSDGAATPSPAAVSASTAVPPPSALASNGVSEPAALTSTIAPSSSTSDSLALVATPTPTPPPKPARKLFQARPVVAQKSLCFSTEGVATSVDVTPDGEIVVVGFTDGSVRLYEMDSSVPSDRHGYLLGHIDETSSWGLATVHLRVKISPDGRYVFVGCRQGPRVVMSINLHHYRNEKDGDDDDFQQFQKYFYCNPRLRGFADATTCVPPITSSQQEPEEPSNKRFAYYLLSGLGVGTLNLSRFVEGTQKRKPSLHHLQAFASGGNTAIIATFLPSSATPGALAIAAISAEKNLRVWPLAYKRAASSAGADSNGGPTTGIAESDYLGGVHTVTTHFNVPSTTDIFAIHGQFAYGISLMGEAYRIRLPDAANMSSGSGDPLPRQAFELEKLDSGGSGKSRRSNIMLESIAASDDGKVAVAVSSEGIFYYSNQLPEAMSDVAILRIIGKNASENMQFKAPMKVYTPVISSNGKTPPKSGEAMMVVVSNPRDDDGDEDPGYFNVDPTEVFASRWMVPSRGMNCWVCGVRNVNHWAAALEPKKTVNAAEVSAEKKAKAKAKAKAKMRRERALQRAEKSAERQSNNRASNPETPSHVRSKPAPQSTSKKGSAQKKRLTPPSAARAASTTAVARPSSMGLEANSAMAEVDADNDDENDDDSAEDSPSVSALTIELEHYKKRNIEIKTEWQRRLQGERQLRRKWKQREEEFLEQLNDSLTKLDTAEVEVDRLRVLLRDAEKRFAFEKARAEQENSVKARYTQLCEQMNDKMALVADQKRLLEQTTRSLLTEVDRNVHALKNAVVLEKNECVVCRDRQSVTAVVPCGHLCFCEQDGETYRRNCPSENPTCPICQQEIVSLLRIY